MKILAIGAHPDDIELGCGGTLAKHKRAGDTIICRVFSAGRDMEFDQRFDTIPFLDIVQYIEGIVKEVEPDIIYTHFEGDLNLDHQIIARAVKTACRPLPQSTVREIYSFEIPSSTEWGYGFNPNVFVDISDTFEEKLKALKPYKDEMRDYPHPRSVTAMGILAMYRGASCGVELAEAFCLIREIK